MSSQIASGPRDPGSRIDDLRNAIRANQVSFPVPVPVFRCQNRPEVQWRLAELYFVHGWSPVILARRYKISSRRVRQLLRSWVARATALGYLQPFVPDEAPASEFNPEPGAADHSALYPGPIHVDARP